MSPSIMELLTFLLLTTVLAPVSCSPAVPPNIPGHQTRQTEGTTPAAESPADHEKSPTSAPSPAAQVAMKPILGRREALNVWPGPDLSPVDTVIFEPIASKGCTTTLSETYGYPCSWDGTTTMYASTTILFQQVNCNGCENVYVYKDMYFCPNQRINATQWRDIPSTSWSTICQPSAAAVRRAEQDTPATTTASDPGVPTIAPGPNPPATPFPTTSAKSGNKGARNPQSGVQPAACPTTVVVQPERSAGKTATTYSSFTTSTVSVECGGCPLVISTALAGYGPPGSFSTTTTLPVGTVTTYACR